LASIPIPRQTAVPNGFPGPIFDIFERMCAVVLLVAASPVLIGAAVVVAILSGQTPLIAHRRVGWRGTALWMWKLRTMWDSDPVSDSPARARGWIEYIDDQSGPELKHEQDGRIRSRFARFCRRHSIDELPQLVHVVRGEMSLVGPRPLTAGELERYYGSAAREMLESRPGLAGLWQVSGRSRLDYAERRRLDLLLVRRRSLGLYLRILLRTVSEIWSGANSW
jgi:exopolysaccharide production protein ExoY